MTSLAVLQRADEVVPRDIPSPSKSRAVDTFSIVTVESPSSASSGVQLPPPRENKKEINQKALAAAWSACAPLFSMTREQESIIVDAWRKLHPLAQCGEGEARATALTAYMLQEGPLEKIDALLKCLVQVPGQDSTALYLSAYRAVLLPRGHSPLLVKESCAVVLAVERAGQAAVANDSERLRKSQGMFETSWPKMVAAFNQPYEESRPGRASLVLRARELLRQSMMTGFERGDLGAVGAVFQSMNQELSAFLARGQIAQLPRLGMRYHQSMQPRRELLHEVDDLRHEPVEKRGSIDETTQHGEVEQRILQQRAQLSPMECFRLGRQLLSVLLPQNEVDAWWTDMRQKMGQTEERHLHALIPGMIDFIYMHIDRLKLQPNL